NAGTFAIAVTLSAASGVDTIVPFTLGGTAVNGADYRGVTAGPLVIRAGSTTGTITGTLIDDGRFATPNKRLVATLGTPTNATLRTPPTHTLPSGEPAPPPAVQFAPASQSVSENAGMFRLTVTLSAPSAVDTTVPFALGGTAVAGVDYGGVTASPLV